MRLILTAELRPKSPFDLQAAADPDHLVTRRWSIANIDLKTLVAVVALASGMIGTQVANSARLSALEHDQLSTNREVQANEAKISTVNIRLTDTGSQIWQGTVSRSAYEHDTAQLNMQIGALAGGQQQLYSLLLQNGTLARPGRRGH